MSNWLSEKQALEFLNLEATEANIRKLRWLAYKKKIRKTVVVRNHQYDQDTLAVYRESKAKGKTVDN